MFEKKVWNAEEMRDAIIEMARRISHRPNLLQTVLIGIRTRGEYLAQRLAKLVDEERSVQLPLGYLDVSFYRDDTRARLKQPVVQQTSIPFDIAEKDIILVDDVLFTGRSVRAALDEIMDFGRPARVELAVLIDRGCRELPIQPDYTGRVVATLYHQKVHVHFQEYDGTDEVVLIDPTG